MPAKKKGKETAKAKAKSQKASDDNDVETSRLHSLLFIKVHEAIKQITEHDVFKNVDQAKPLTIAQGGRQMPFDSKMVLKALEKGWFLTVLLV